jgi:hypothetical protein
MAEGIGQGSWGVAFLVAATFMADIVAKACSSPQTAEINIAKRSDTLMKWVNVGLVEGACLVTVALLVDRKYRTPILMGALAEGVITWAEYAHAKRSGLRTAGPSTEGNAAAS